MASTMRSMVPCPAPEKGELRMPISSDGAPGRAAPPVPSSAKTGVFGPGGAEPTAHPPGPGAVAVEQRPDYLYAQFTTRWLKFVDDVEFWAAPASGMVQVRSASRLGQEDMGVNRERVELIRTRLAKAN